MNMITIHRYFLACLLITSPTLFAANAEPFPTNPAERQRIEQALPAKAPAQPVKPRKLLIFDANVGYGGHPSALHANYAFTLMGQRTGAFQTVVSRDPAVFQPQSLKQFDAVFFNNNVGNLFEDRELRQSLVEFVYSGGGLMGVHGTTVAFTKWPGAIEDWPEFGIMIGARGANHRDSNEPVVIKLDDPTNPINQCFAGRGFDYRDEFFRAQDPYSRDRLRILFSIDNAKTDATQGGPARGNAMRADKDYALAWVRNYGRGRVFYCTIAHNPSVFWDPLMLQFYLAATQFALGDLHAPTLPSNRLTPATLAQERLGWRLGLQSPASAQCTLFDSIDQAAHLRLSYLDAHSSQKVSKDLPKNFAPGLSPTELQQIRLKLDSAGVRPLTYAVDSFPTDESACRQIFVFARKMGIETLIAHSSPNVLPLLDRLCAEYDLTLALETGNPDDVIKLCQSRSPRIGAAADPTYWLAHDIDPLQAIRTLNSRLFALRLPSPTPLIESLLTEIHRLNLHPPLFTRTPPPRPPPPP
ncbi:MAG: ThuA domain-containing protein, partial [Bacillota bacterium]